MCQQQFFRTIYFQCFVVEQGKCPRKRGEAPYQVVNLCHWLIELNAAGVGKYFRGMTEGLFFIRFFFKKLLWFFF